QDRGRRDARGLGRGHRGPHRPARPGARGVSGVLVLAEARRGELREVSLELVSAALALRDAAGGPLTVALIDADAAALAPALAASGVDEVLTVAPGVEGFEPDVWARALEALIAALEPAVVLVGHTIDSMGFAPAVAARAG